MRSDGICSCFPPIFLYLSVATVFFCFPWTQDAVERVERDHSNRNADDTMTVANLSSDVKDDDGIAAADEADKASDVNDDDAIADADEAGKGSDIKDDDAIADADQCSEVAGQQQNDVESPLQDVHGNVNDDTTIAEADHGNDVAGRQDDVQSTIQDVQHVAADDAIVVGADQGCAAAPILIDSDTGSISNEEVREEVICSRHENLQIV